MTIFGIFGALYSGGSSLALSAKGIALMAGTAAADEIISNLTEWFSGGELYIATITERTGEKTSIAYSLRNTVASYYRVLQEVALVILLATLVYVAIRMITSSTAEDKAKYKKMLADWLTAVVVVYLLHFIISITLTVVQAINDVFYKMVFQDGRDVFMSTLRTGIGVDPENTDLSNAFFNIVVYLVLVIYTIQFTVMYLKRVIHMAFLTIISPMVAFTYALDRIRDGKAQGLSLWLKEFMFNALMQPIHMILYAIFVGGSLDMVIRNPIYALVMIGFLKPAEKFIRQLFGLSGDESMGSMASAMGGAAIMNSLNKIKQRSVKHEAQKQAGNAGKVRTANQGAKDPLDALRKSGGPKPITTPTPTPSIKNKPKTRSGVWNVVKTKGGKALANMPRGALKLVGAAALGTVGLAAGIATGDTKNIFAGTLGGMTAGKNMAGNMYDGTKNAKDNIKEKFGEGKYGKDEYARQKFDKEFKKSAEYRDLTKRYEESEADIQEFLNAGFTDPKQMGTALENVKNGRYNDIDEAMAYMKMANAEDCPDEVLNDPTLFATYLDSRGIDSSNADTIRRGIIDFK